jgi:hypothetical protein
MISVAEVVQDPDMISPQDFVVLRSVGQYVLGGFQSTTTSIPMFGPVQQAAPKEIAMLPEADRIGSIRSFWAVVPIYVTRGYAPVPGVHGETPTGSGTAYTLSAAPPNNQVNVYAHGLLLPATVYTVAGPALTFGSAPTAPLYVTWEITVNAQAAASDIIQFEDFQYRILSVFRVPGSGYWKALGTRTAAA